MARPELIKTINRLINSTDNFISDDFIIQDLKDGAVRIKYKYDPRYSFLFEPTYVGSSSEKNISDQYRFNIRLNPGYTSEDEYYQSASQLDMYDMIPEWLERLWDDLTAYADNESFSSQKVVDDIHNHFEKITDSKYDTYFTRTEANEIKIRLDVLEKTIQNEIIKGADEQNEESSKAAIEDLHKQIESLKATILALKKKPWYESMTVKMAVWLTKSENRKLLQEAGSLVKPLLPDSFGDLLPPFE